MKKTRESSWNSEWAMPLRRRCCYTVRAKIRNFLLWRDLHLLKLEEVGSCQVKPAVMAKLVK